MKKILMTFLVCLISCGPTREVVQIYTGTPGATGETGATGEKGDKGDDGANGHSLVSQYMPATSLECDSTGGSRLDVYVDLDDSLTASEGDVYLNSLVACNGLNGLNGTDGQDGSDGTNGNNGINGHDGVAGPPGSSGPPGLDGNPGHDGLPGPSGAPGTPGAPGQNGSNGSNGTNGQDGAPGQDGKDAHVTPRNITGNCSSLSTNYDALIKNNTVEIYTAGYSCSPPKKVFVMTDSASTFWLSSTELAVFVTPAGVRILGY